MAIRGTIESLEAIGFDFRGEFNIPMHYGFSKREKVSANLYVYKEGNPEIELNLAFRDHLRSHADDSIILSEISGEKDPIRPDVPVFTSI